MPLRVEAHPPVPPGSSREGRFERGGVVNCFLWSTSLTLILLRFPFLIWEETSDKLRGIWSGSTTTSELSSDSRLVLMVEPFFVKVDNWGALVGEEGPLNTSEIDCRLFGRGGTGGGSGLVEVEPVKVEPSPARFKIEHQKHAINTEGNFFPHIFL
jgi:hypothetical protein